MQKKSLLIISILGLFLISLVSAYSYGNGIALGEMLDNLDSQTVFLLITFGIAFIMINWALLKTIFRGNKTYSGLTAFLISFLIAYEINRRGFDLEGLFYGFGLDLGFSQEFLYASIPVIIIAVFIFAAVLTGIGNAVVFLGASLIVLGYLSADSGTAIIGLIIVLFGGFVKYKWPRTRNPVTP